LAISDAALLYLVDKLYLNIEKYLEKGSFIIPDFENVTLADENVTLADENVTLADEKLQQIKLFHFIHSHSSRIPQSSQKDCKMLQILKNIVQPV